MLLRSPQRPRRSPQRRVEAGCMGVEWPVRLLRGPFGCKVTLAEMFCLESNRTEQTFSGWKVPLLVGKSSP
eukprot:7127265-Pyramimonas_sp.AAC.1